MCQNRKTHNKIMAVNMAHTLGLRGGDSRFIHIFALLFFFINNFEAFNFW